MTKIKFCGLSRPEDIAAANMLRPDYIGFVFAKDSRRYISPETAKELKKQLSKGILTVGVFVNEAPEQLAELLNCGLLDLAQLHGTESEDYLRRLRLLTKKPVLQAFRVKAAHDLALAEHSSADYILLDSGAGTGKVFDWQLLKKLKREFFLAGGLYPENAGKAIHRLQPFALDVSSGIEKNGIKDREKMEAFAAAVRKADSEPQTSGKSICRL